MDIQREEGVGAALRSSPARSACSVASSPRRLFLHRRVVLAAHEVGIDVARRHQPNLVADRDQLARSMAQSRTDQARSEPS